MLTARTHKPSPPHGSKSIVRLDYWEKTPQTRHRRTKTMLDPLSKKIKFPISPLPRRKLKYPFKVEIPKLNLQATQQFIVTNLRKSNSDRRLQTLSVLDKKEVKRVPSLLSPFQSPGSPNTERVIPMSDVTSRKLSMQKDGLLAFLHPTLDSQIPPEPTLPEFPFKPTIDRKERARKAFSAIKHFIQLSLPCHIIPKLGLFIPNQAYAAKNSFQFLMACRTGDKERVQKMLIKNRWLTLEFDRVKKTGLHWAAIRDHVGILDALVKAGAYIDARDCIGRTPLFFASKYGHTPTVRYLLTHKANPFLRTDGNKSPVSVATDKVVRDLLVHSMQLTVLLKFVEVTKKRVAWGKQGLDFFKADAKMMEDL